MGYMKVYLATMSMLVLMIAGIIADNQIRGRVGLDCRRDDLREIAPLMMSADTAINNSARYIRHYSLSYPASAFSDFPGQQDYLPAGMAWSVMDFPGVNTRLCIGDSPAREQKGTP